MLAGVTPLPVQIAESRSNSVSKQVQQSLPKFKISPRGVRLFVGKSLPNWRASRTEEKKGKSRSTKSAQGDLVTSGFSVSALAAPPVKGVANSPSARPVLRARL